MMVGFCRSKQGGLPRGDVEDTGLDRLDVTWGVCFPALLSLELPRSQDERAVAIFRKKGFCWFISPLAKIGNTQKGAAGR